MPAPLFRRAALFVLITTAGLPPTLSAQAAKRTAFDPQLERDRYADLFVHFFNRKPGRHVSVGPDGITFRFDPLVAHGGVGVAAKKFHLPGDFHIEVKFDATALPEDADDHNVFFALGAPIAMKQGGLSVTRGVWVDNGPGFDACRDVPRRKGIYYNSCHSPSAARQGRLALRRVGSEALALAAEGGDGQLQELARFPYPAEPVREILMWTDAGGAAVPLAVRLYDLEVRSGADVTPVDYPRREKVKINRPYLPPEPDGPAPTKPAAAPATAPAPVVVAAPAPTAGPVAAEARLPWLLPLVAFAAGVVVGRVLPRRARSTT